MSALSISSRMKWVNADGTPTRELLQAWQEIINRTGGTAGQIEAIDVLFSPTGGISSDTVQAMGAELDAEKASNADLTAHTSNTSNPHSVTKSQVGLGNVDNTSDADKPVSTATATALAGKANTAHSHVTGDITGLGTMATQSASSVGITGGSILATTALGFNTGAGGTVTQSTDKTTGVTLDELTGEITLNNAPLAASTTVSFTLTNSTIGATDQLVVTHQSGGTGGAYFVSGRPAAGSATIYVRNVTAGSLSEAIVLKFTVIRAPTS